MLSYDKISPNAISRENFLKLLNVFLCWQAASMLYYSSIDPDGI